MALIPLPRVAALAAMLVATALGTAPAPAQQRVGVNTAVNPQASGTPPGASAKRLVLGQDVVYNERIETAAAGQTQILFVDQSSMSVGPNSNMVIDQFVYDPHTGTGKMAASITRGVFRFVGGELSKHDNAVTMRTPSATIGIRGGLFLLTQQPNGKLDVIFEYGNSLSVTGNNGQQQTITRPGFQITVAGPGAPPSAPSPAPPGAAAAIVVQLDGQGGANGGAQTIPTDAVAESNGIGNPNSSVLTPSVVEPSTTDLQSVLSSVQNVVQNSVQNASQGGALPPVSPPTTTPPPSVTVAGGFYSTGDSTQGFTSPTVAYSSGSLSNGVFTADLGSSLGTLKIPLASGYSTFSGTDDTTATPLGPVAGVSYLAPDGSFFYAYLIPTSQPNQREFLYGGQGIAPGAATAPIAFDILPDAALLSTIPFIRADTGGNMTSPSVSPLLVATPPNATGFAAASGASTKALQSSFAISGSGANQSSVLVVAVGNTLAGGPAGQAILSGAVSGSYRAGGTSAPVLVSAPLTTPSDGNGNSFYGSGSTISGFIVSNGVNGGGGASGLATETTPGGTSANYGFAQPAMPLSTVALGTQTTQTQTGYFGGIMQPFTSSGAGTPYPVTGTTSVSTDAANYQVAATFNGYDPSESSGVNNVQLQFGNTTPGLTRGRQAYIDDSHFAALQNPIQPTQVNHVPLTGSGDPLQGTNIYMVTGATVPATGLLPGGTLCQCQYLQWGWWGGQLNTGTAVPIDSNGDTDPSRIDVGHINSWVAGIPTSTVDLQALESQGSYGITGNYAGNMVGSVYNNGAQYLASGGLQGTYNFGTGAGSITVSNYDGHSFTASGTNSPGSGSYTAVVNGQGNLYGALNGTFYGPKAAETGGNFALQNAPGGTPTYVTSGTFAAKGTSFTQNPPPP